ncbi:hypothetical protein [Ralstonia pseudosolanacearum]|uniref:hypothetical protein n=1 Tax=Ralstonia pseudosolanacearum TaxID=1310165 RepID=UPI001FFB1B20|nr:hypothetical protein [Ralstonia pseudosolanacearum]MDO3525202.1 hypothetical protein [Ralstonia pseudosolanacearum]MDO3549738.1 hypothetical protein [Ralstonia pseudosolanacearum]MDO3554930.1 hypothetical protein [Ralstonia pseudosolanacearum]MDO3569584.1 hypothetical protein [Ralstonia pseudosolanacearum]MDO3584414.1 hypothetical protein [Ralstonia pseudosolanacearum]
MDQFMGEDSERFFGVFMQALRRAVSAQLDAGLGVPVHDCAAAGRFRRDFSSRELFGDSLVGSKIRWLVRCNLRPGEDGFRTGIVIGVDLADGQFALPGRTQRADTAKQFIPRGPDAIFPNASFTLPA